MGLAGALAFLVLGSGVEQEWARDPNMKVEFDVYTIDKRKQSIDQPHASVEEGDCTAGNGKKVGMNSVSENRNVKVELGHVNDNFVEQVNKEKNDPVAIQEIITYHF